MLWTAVGAVGGVAGAFMGVFALVQTNKTNDIAKDANDKADEANQIAEKALRHDIEDSHVDWEADWNEETQSLIVTNTARTSPTTSRSSSMPCFPAPVSASIVPKPPQGTFLTENR